MAVHLARKRGDEVPEALLAIQEASGEANRELRSTLEVLREPAPEGHPAAGDRASLEHLDALVARTRLTGLSVSATVNGQRPKIPTAVDRTAYRIIQEALTNVTRHAGAGASATIRLDYGRDGFSVRVEDDGRAAAEEPHVPGTGLLGMRERVMALGGDVTVGPRPEGGFRVHAELPLRSAEQGSVSAEASS
ncbi:signal transduction histidine kinase [Lipingzhangella halophila]|uniref:histidine kinase n=1 Tax=Lipingzhangella halophila TaxID=1783352 RepID=A0A7W7REK9_9ACTN|nr:ATP-binding protein [Lipingzhangella halophila]MBB4930218.1 signal transduction histidine kinase [Lipingzhangella halophila]